MKQHIVLDDEKWKDGNSTQTLCGREGLVVLSPAQLVSAKGTTFTVAHQAHFNDKRFCNTCRHIWRRITSA